MSLDRAFEPAAPDGLGAPSASTGGAESTPQGMMGRPGLFEGTEELSELRQRAERAELERDELRAVAEQNLSLDSWLCNRVERAEADAVAAREALLARDGELEQARDLARKRGDHAMLIGQALDLSKAKLGRAEAAIARARRLLSGSLAIWKGEHAYFQERAERKGYSHDEARTEVYGAAIEAAREVLASLKGLPVSQETIQREQLLELIGDLADPDPCWFDHHGGCQAHGYLSLKTGERCPHAVAQELLRQEQTGGHR